MDNGNFGQLVSFVFGIANDCLVDVYDVGDYRKIILPMMVIRRFDAVLEPTKQEVLKMKKQLDEAGVTEQDDALCAVAKEAFCNSSPYTLSDLKSRTNQQQLKNDFILYLDGFSTNVQDIIKKFEFRNQIDKLSDHDILGLLITKFTDQSVNLSSRSVVNAAGVTLPALDNHTMGTVFEEVIRKFNEETNVTDAGRHFTPRDIVELITDLAFVPIKDKIKSTTYSIYDGACGTGGMLTVAEQRISEIAGKHKKKVSINLYGQENADETYAIARSDMLVKGEGSQADHIFFGSTISNDGFSGRTFDFCLSNPPFGTPWKKDLIAWGDIKKEEITDSRFIVEYNGKTLSLVPDIGDPQMLFLANNISKMKPHPFGTRIVEVHNGSSLFTGKAGQGASNLRQFIIEQDLLEAIVAIPEKMFYNTGIGTYLWVLTNKKEKRRKGKIQLIDTTSFKSPLRKNLGEKNCEVTPDIREQILELYLAFDKADNRYSKIFDNSEFGYWSITVERPLRLRVYPDREIPETIFKTENDRTAVREALASLPENTPLDDWTKFAKKTKLKASQLKKIRPFITEKDSSANPIQNEFDADLRDTEAVPFNYPGGIKEFMRQEVLPYAPDAVVNAAKTQVGYELSFTKYFYQPVQLRTLDEITADIRAIEQETDGLLDEILGGAL